jgi:hypothetical protein
MILSKLTAGLVALLIGIFIYQAAYGYSTNITFSKGHTPAYEYGYDAALNNGRLYLRLWEQLLQPRHISQTGWT